MQPMQAHLSLTEDNTQMRLMWVSASENVPIVQYGISRSLNMFANGTSHTYNSTQLCDNWMLPMYWIDPGNMHDVVMTNLEPSTNYFYRYGNDQDGWSEVQQFTSAKPLGDPSVNIFAFADMGTAICIGEGWCEQNSNGTTNNVYHQLLESEYDMVLHVGDISYAVGYSIRWEEFFAQIQPIATEVPYMVCIGNHEYDYSTQPFHPYWSNYGDDSQGECGVPFLNRFHMPHNSLWYSFDYGNVHFTLISTEHDFETKYK